eukprot:139563-Pyramimonas_sp.AAC.1
MDCVNGIPHLRVPVRLLLLRRVVSCVGAFGSNEFMEKVCGDATVSMVEAAKAAKVKNFVFISAHDYQLPSFVLSGYVAGKKCAPFRNKPRSRRPKRPSTSIRLSTLVYHSAHSISNIPPNIR